MPRPKGGALDELADSSTGLGGSRSPAGSSSASLFGDIPCSPPVARDALGHAPSSATGVQLEELRVDRARIEARSRPVGGDATARAIGAHRKGETIRDAPRRPRPRDTIVRLRGARCKSRARVRPGPSYVDRLQPRRVWRPGGASVTRALIAALLPKCRSSSQADSLAATRCTGTWIYVYGDGASEGSRLGFPGPAQADSSEPRAYGIRSRS